MSDAMTSETCRASQRECSKAIFDEINSLRREVKADIGLIREAVQTIDRAVSAVKGYLGLNGNAGDQRDAAHLHKRNAEEIEHLHRRITDLIEAAKEQSETAVAAALAASKSAVKAAEDSPPADWRVKVMWGLGLFAAGAVGTPILGALGAVLAKRLMP